MKRRIAKGLCWLLALLLLAGCEAARETEEQAAGAEDPIRLSVTASFWPLYAAAGMVMKDVPDVELHCLTQPQAGCLRGYRLSEWDAALLSGADLVIVGGRGLESFTLPDDVPHLTLMTDMELLAGSGQEALEDHFSGDNPWMFLSIDGMVQWVETLGAQLATADPRYADLYAENAQRALEVIEQARESVEETLLPADVGPVALFHEGLAYIAEDFDLYVAATIQREAAEDLDAAGLREALATLSQTGATLCLLEEQAPDRLARDLEQAGYRVARLDTMTMHAEGDPWEWTQIVRENARRVAEAAG